MRILTQHSLERLRPAVTAALAAFVLALAAAPAAEARSGPCVPGAEDTPVCEVWDAKVVAVNDGDTIDVRLGGRVRRVRFTSVQAMEQTRYRRVASERRGECHSLEATARVEQLLRRGGKRVRLAALRPGSRTSDGRLLRGVATRIRGRWVDVGETLIAEGHALWLWNRTESAWNRRYSMAAERAAARGARLWDSDYCGAGPGRTARLRLWIEPDADGNDLTNVNGEWAKIKNLDRSADLSLAGWWFRDAAHSRFRFPAWARIPAGGTITIHMGRGTSGGNVFHRGLDLPTFPTTVRDSRDAAGDGGYLFDPQGDLRAWMIYPCETSCASDFRGALDLTAEPRSPESVRVANPGDSAADLEGYRLVSGENVYEFGADALLMPGEAILVRTTGSRGGDTRLEKNWGLRRPILGDAGGSVTLETSVGEVLDCFAWGRASC